MKVRNENRTKNSTGRVAIALSALLAAAPLAEGCRQAEPTQSSVTLTCERSDSRPQRTVNAGYVELALTGRCGPEGVEEVDVKMPCGSNRFEESCTLTLSVPGEVTFKRGSREGIRRLEISVSEGEGASAVVEVK